MYVSVLAVHKGSAGYQRTVDELWSHLANIELPVQSMQYDSWWYYKGPNAGVMLWEPEPSTLGGDAVDGAPSTYAKNHGFCASMI